MGVLLLNLQAQPIGSLFLLPPLRRLSHPAWLKRIRETSTHFCSHSSCCRILCCACAASSTSPHKVDKISNRDDTRFCSALVTTSLCCSYAFSMYKAECSGRISSIVVFHVNCIASQNGVIVLLSPLTHVVLPCVRFVCTYLELVLYLAEL